MLLLDNNLSYRLKKELSKILPTFHVSDFSLEKSSDLEIWNYAKTNGYHIVTKDVDFEVLLERFGFPPKIIHLNIGNRNRSQIIDIINARKSRILDFINHEEQGELKIKLDF